MKKKLDNREKDAARSLLLQMARLRLLALSPSHNDTDKQKLQVLEAGLLAQLTTIQIMCEHSYPIRPTHITEDHELYQCIDCSHVKEEAKKKASV